MLESRVQALGSEELRTEKEKMGSPEGFFLEEVGLGKDLKHGQSLGKEASMLKEESAGYESLHDFVEGEGWGRGALVPDLVVPFLTLCVDAWLLQRSLFPGNPSPAWAQQGQSLWPLALLLWGLRGSESAQDGSATWEYSASTRGLMASLVTLLGSLKGETLRRVCV